MDHLLSKEQPHRKMPAKVKLSGIAQVVWKCLSYPFRAEAAGSGRAKIEFP